MKISFKGFYKPTPKRIRKIADSILASFSLLSCQQMYVDHKTIASISLIIALVAKFASNMCSEDDHAN